MNIPRARLRTSPTEGEGWNFFFNCIPGLLPRRGVMAVRLDAAVREFNPERAHVRYFNDRYTGWVILFSTKTGEPLAIMDDFSLSGIRVGATVGVGARYLAKKGASRVALYGSGKQARTNLEAVSKVRKLDEVRVYSPNPEHRVLFAQEMTHVVGAEIVPVDSPEKAMDGVDMVLCTANSMEPVFDGGWLKPGVFVSSISVGNDKTITPIWGRVRRELDDETLGRADRVVISSRAQAIWDDQKHLLALGEKHGFGPDRQIPEIGDLLLGRVPGRETDDQVTVFANNTGTGNQFAAAGAVVYENARKQGVGRELPNEWFMSDVSEWAARGFYPSP
jgi:ornithine cyclodeaminase/alanine dehydrogenase-like protein (mu-crystallin family)